MYLFLLAHDGVEHANQVEQVTDHTNSGFAVLAVSLIAIAVLALIHHLLTKSEARVKKESDK